MQPLESSHPVHAVAQGSSRNAHRKPRKSRGRGLRTTTGCAICRTRHMKCDEVKPVCGPCSKGHRQCIYAPLSADDIVRTNGNAPDAISLTAPTPTRASVSSQSNAQRRSSHASFTSTTPQTSWPTTMPRTEDVHQPNSSPQNTYSQPVNTHMELTPLRWRGSPASHVPGRSPTLLSPELMRNVDTAPPFQTQVGDGLATPNLQTSSDRPASIAASAALPSSSRVACVPPASPARSTHPIASIEGNSPWQTSSPVRLNDHEHVIFHRYVTGISAWLDLFDPHEHFSTLVPHLALQNEGLIKAILALGSRHLSIKPLLNGGEATTHRTAGVQYYYETLQYLQSAMRYPSYKNSPEVLATLLVVSKYEMINGAGEEWERHLKGVFWILRSREINGESNGLERATWWAWLRQDVWAAFRAHRRCLSFFTPTKPYHGMDSWDMASRVVYILAQAVNYVSDEEKRHGEADLTDRIQRANVLLDMLDEWRRSLSVHFEPLPINASSNRDFPPLWIHPPAFGNSVQMYCTAKILLLVNQPAAGGYLEYMGREKVISECVDTIGGIALLLNEDAFRLMSTQCLFAAGLYCTDQVKRDWIVELILDHQSHTGWPSKTNLADELCAEWAKQKTG